MIVDQEVARSSRAGGTIKKPGRYAMFSRTKVFSLSNRIDPVLSEKTHVLILRPGTVMDVRCGGAIFKVSLLIKL